MKKKHVNFDKHHVEKRHNKRFLGLFLMFAVIAVFIGFVLAFTVKSSVTGDAITGNSFLGIDWAWNKPATGELAGASASAGASFGITCTDSDGGIKPYVKGVVRHNGKTYTDFCWKNGVSATSSNVVAEFYCWKNVADRSLMYCPSGCVNGACVNVTQVNPGFIESSPGAELDEMKELCMNGGTKCENSMN